MNDKLYERRGVVVVAVNVHSTATGSYDRPAEEQQADVAILKAKLAGWYHGLRGDSPFDETCKRLIELAIQESQV